MLMKIIYGEMIYFDLFIFIYMSYFLLHLPFFHSTAPVCSLNAPPPRLQPASVRAFSKHTKLKNSLLLLPSLYYPLSVYVTAGEMASSHIRMATKVTLRNVRAHYSINISKYSSVQLLLVIGGLYLYSGLYS